MYTLFKKYMQACHDVVDDDESCLDIDNHHIDGLGTGNSSKFHVLWGLSSKRYPIVNCAVHRPRTLNGPCSVPRAHVDLPGHPLQDLSRSECEGDELTSNACSCALDNSEIPNDGAG